MYTRRLGKSNIEVSALGMGCWAIGGPFRSGRDGRFLAYGQVNDKESIATVHKALDLGINLFDTADVYGFGHSEKILGEALKGRRNQVIIATKFGNMFDEKTRTSKSKKSFEPEYIRHALDDSLRRLQTDYIDLYQIHHARYSSDGALQVQNTLEELVEEGKIRYYGWSTDDASRAAKFAKGKYCAAIQYVLTLTRINTPIAKLCEENDLAGLIRSPLASGTLTGKYNKDTKRASDHMLANTDFSTERYQKTFQALNQLKELIAEDERTLVQTILGYIWAKNDHAIPIPGAKTITQISENAKVLELGPISQKLMREIDTIFSDLQMDFSYENFEYYKEGKK
ncbi:MAG: aldo/keto reductase [Promethearchaeota archaeon]